MVQQLEEKQMKDIFSATLNYSSYDETTPPPDQLKYKQLIQVEDKDFFLKE